MADLHFQDSPSSPSHSDPSNSDRDHHPHGGADLFSPYNSSSSDHSSPPNNDVFSPGASCSLGVQSSLFDGAAFSSLMGSLGVAGDGVWSPGYAIGASGIYNAAASPRNDGGNNIAVGDMDEVPESFWLRAGAPNPAPSIAASAGAEAARRISDAGDKGMDFGSLVVEECCGPSSMPSPMSGASLQPAAAPVDPDIGTQLQNALSAFPHNPTRQGSLASSATNMDVDMSSAFLHQGSPSTDAITFSPAWLSQATSTADAPKSTPVISAAAGLTGLPRAELNQSAALVSSPCLLAIPGGFPSASPTEPTAPSARPSPTHTDAHGDPSSSSSRQLTEVEAAIPVLCRPPKDAPHDNLDLILLGVALDGAKSRVETQVKITMVLVRQVAGKAKLGEGAVDGRVLAEGGTLVEGAGTKAGLERVGSWKHVKLPAFSAIKRRSKKLIRMGIPAEETLFLDVAVIRATEPREEIFCCNACQSRERKRIQRKRDARVRPAQEVDSDSEDGAEGDEKRKIVLFNCGQYLDFETGEVTLPARITCYCRHHKEKKGFCIVITLRDATDTVVASGVTPPIMITDDHKAAAAAAKASRPPSDAEKNLNNLPGRKFAVRRQPELPTVGKVTPRRGSADHSSANGDQKPKRKAPYDASQRNSNRRTSSHLSRSPSFAMTPLMTSSSMSKPSSPVPRPVAPRTAPTSPASSPNQPNALGPLLVSSEQVRADSVSGLSGLNTSGGAASTQVNPRAAATAGASSSGTTPTAVPNSDVVMRDESGLSHPSQLSSPDVTRQNRLQASPPGSPGASVDSFSSVAQSSATSLDTHLALPGTSGHEPPASQLLDGSGNLGLLNPLPASLSWVVQTPTNNGQSQINPKIGRLIPSEGPMQGGIEVTILGEGFFPGIVCVFGDTPAVPTHLWSTNTLVCTLPPSASPGPCVVSFRGIPITVSSGNSVQVFTYVDNSDQKLMELALQVVGLQMTGRIQDAKNVAMRIVGESASGNHHGSSGGGYQGGAQRGAGTIDNGDLSSMAATLATAAASIMNSPSQSRPLSRANSGTNLRGDALAGPAAELLETHNFESIIIRFLTLLNFYPSDAVEEARLPTSPISLQNAQGHTLLHLAVNLGFHKLVNYLLRNGVAINARDKNAFTPLHFAALAGRVTITRLLLEAGAATYYRNCAARTALDLARDRDQVDIVELFGRFQSRSADNPGRYSRTFSEASSAVSSPRPSLVSSPVLSANESAEGSSGDVDSIAGRTSDESDAAESRGRVSRSPSAASLAGQLMSEPARPKLLGEADEVPDAQPLSDEEPSSCRPDARAQETESSTPASFGPMVLGAGVLRKLPLVDKLRFATPSISGITEVPAYTMYGLAALNPKTWRQWPSKSRANSKIEALSEKTGLVPAAGTKSASDWRSMYSQWWQIPPAKEATTSQRRVPMYPPSEDDRVTPSGPLAPTSTSMDGTSTPGKAMSKTQLQAKLAHRLGYTPTVVDEGVVEAFAYHSSKYRSLKKDKMLYLFWIPVLFLALSYALYESFVFLQPRLLDMLPGFSIGSGHSMARVY